MSICIHTAYQQTQQTQQTHTYMQASHPSSSPHTVISIARSEKRGKNETKTNTKRHTHRFVATMRQDFFDITLQQNQLLYLQSFEEPW